MNPTDHQPTIPNTPIPSAHLEPSRVAPRRPLLLPQDDLVCEHAAGGAGPPGAPQRVVVGAAVEGLQEGLVGPPEHAAGRVVVRALVDRRVVDEGGVGVYVLGCGWVVCCKRRL